jgi:arginyl-tRNA synthetase
MLVIKQSLKEVVQRAVKFLQNNNDLPVGEDIVMPDVLIEPTKDESHGDYATNFALMAAKLAKTNPRALAEKLVNSINRSQNGDLIADVQIAGPGFINFYLAPNAYYQIICDIAEHKNNYGKSDVGGNKKIHIEFVSANPTSPLHVGHGRHAAFGDCVANLLEHIGFDVHREYYVNDAGRQMQILAYSLWVRYLEQQNIEISLPKKAYQGEYIKDIADKLITQEQDRLCSDEIVNKFKQELANRDLIDNEENGDQYIDANVQILKNILGERDFKICLDLVLTEIQRDIKEDLGEFGVHYDNWFSEEQMIAEGAISKTISELEAKNYLYKKDGAIWFKTSELGDEKDRVLIRSNGQNTYFAPDIAYHLNKLERGSDFIIDILGSDHHGYIPRLRACLRAFGKADEQFVTKLVQFVNLYRGDKKVQMSSRSGSFVTLRELREEVGNDAVRFLYVERKVDQLVDFDIELAKSKSQENPVYYVQYAHARICSVMRQLEEKGYTWDNRYNNLEKLANLTEDLELALLKQMSKYIDFIAASALAYEPHRVVQYLKDLAHLFHRYYNTHPVLVEDDNIRNARLCLILAVKQVLSNALGILGVSSPEKM